MKDLVCILQGGDEKGTQLRSAGVLLLALVLAAMAMAPAAGAEKIVPVDTIFGMKYFSDVPDPAEVRSFQQPAVSEYSLVTVDPSAFIRDAENGEELECTLDGEKYSIDLSGIPGVLAPDAKLYIITGNGTMVTDVPQIKQYEGRIVGNKPGKASFTVDASVILGSITTDDESYFIGQYGTLPDGRIVHIVYNSKNELTRENLPDGDDIFPVPGSPGRLPIPDKKYIRARLAVLFQEGHV